MALLLVSGATRTVGKFPVGRLVVPRGRNRPEALALTAGRWAMDNGAFREFDCGAFVRMLERFYPYRSGCLFVSVPDALGNAATTLLLWPFWSRLVRGIGYPAAFVAQDGQTVETAPWDEMACLFIGGTTTWKLGREARTLAAYAKARGLWLHVGRVNSRRRLRYITQMGADSYDGTSVSKYAETQIPKRLRWAEELRRQPELTL